ncbi:hypothetical protein BT96DRAFT_939162 [Gymnopus androsaceus JB14]|uniref:Uncharacterized protein n=1 Tax=Gymnopus androsaceus JB14 TaxID=1447944 RepID=A0A6A4HLP8_9AGAR|nr:hypothetical protein BT96DRAFT_939162 [Gymnopus androsaceus JB14]
MNRIIFKMSTCDPGHDTEEYAFAAPFSLVGNSIYTCLGGICSLPAIPPRHYTVNESNKDMHTKFISFNWISNAHPYLLLVPKDPWLFPVFSRLNMVSNLSAPIVAQYPDPKGNKQHSQGWALNPVVILGWTRLEMAMHEILRIMMQMTKQHGGKGTDCGFDFWTRPGQYDYRKAFATSELACTAAIRSKYVFIPLIAMLTYYTLLCKAYWVLELSTLTEVSQTAWIQYIAKKSRYQEEWVWMLISTLLVKTKCVSGVIDMKSCGFIHSIPLIQEFDPNCIILLHWGEDFDIRKYPTMINIETPSEEQVVALRHQKNSRSIHTFPDRRIDTEQIYVVVVNAC